MYHNIQCLHAMFFSIALQTRYILITDVREYIERNSPDTCHISDEGTI